MSIVRWSGTASAILTILAVTPVQAKRYELTVTGTINRVTVINQGVFSYDPVGLAQTGDMARLSMRFDTPGAQPAALFDADPSINIYDLGGAKVALTLGQYRYRYVAGYYPASISAQLWNDRQVGSSLVDAQSFSYFDYPIGYNKPQYAFDVGQGSISESMTVNLFDFTHSARSSDNISELIDPSAFSYRGFSYSILNSSIDKFVMASVDQASVTLTALPEPEHWLMMVGGFAAAGVSMRRRRVALARS